MSIMFVGLIGLIAYLRFTGQLSTALLNRLVAGGVGLLALRLGFTGSPIGGVLLGAAAAAFWWSTDETRKNAVVDDARARAILGLDPRAGPDAIRAAYLRCAAAAHPDRGGNTADMQALNAARDRLLRRARGPARRA